MLALVIIFTVITFFLLGFAIYKTIGLVKNKMPNLINYPLEVKKLAYIISGLAVSTLVLFIFICSNNNYPLTGGEWAELVFGSLLFSVGVGGGLCSFILHYYGKQIPKKLDKSLFISILVGVFSFFVGLILLTNSFADYLVYPLMNGISFKTGIAVPSSGSDARKANITFYALCILSGALLTYVVADHRFYKEYGKHGILESTLYVAFPAGILGARIGYVIGNWNGDVAHGVESFAERVARGEWWSIIAIWEGGLTILAGALVGIIVGVIWFVTRKKQYSIWLAIDVIVPAILIAQAVGRWGNFFNCEVYGFDVPASDWGILPKIVLNNMRYNSSGAMNAAVGMIHLPLFIIEGTINLVGFFVIRFALGNGVKKYLEPGDLGAAYLIWYGTTRVLLEPLRAQEFNMGTKGYWSWFWSFFFIIGGALLICANHLIRYVINVKKDKVVVLKDSYRNGLIAAGAFIVPAIALISVGAFLMATGTKIEVLTYCQYSNGMLVLFIGLALLLLSGVTVPFILSGKNKNVKKA